MTADFPDRSGLLCHHGDDEDGHPLAADCPLLVKVSGPSAYARPQVGGGRHTAATGTCPVCGRGGVKVVAYTVRAVGPAEQFVTAIGKGVPLGIRPQLVTHKRPERGGGPCPAVAAVPVELRYTPSAGLAGWVRDFGQEHVA